MVRWFPATVATTSFDGRVLRQIFEGYEKAMQQANAVDFEDLIGHVTRLSEAQLVQAGQELRERFDHVLVMEQGKLVEQGIKARVVSFPSWELFDKQPQEYRDSVLPPAIGFGLILVGAWFVFQKF